MAAPSTKERLRIRILIASHSSSKVPEQSRKHLPKTPWAPPELDLITIEIIVRNDWQSFSMWVEVAADASIELGDETADLCPRSFGSLRRGR